MGGIERATGGGGGSGCGMKETGVDAADEEEAKATVEMLVSRSLLLLRRAAPPSYPAFARSRAAVGGKGLERRERYAMHALQAAYVRSAARTRLDLMKTLGPRREAALAVIGPDGITAAEAAAAAAAAGTSATSAGTASTARGSSPSEHP